MSEQKEKKYYFMQMKNTFFQDEDQVLIEGMAIERGLDPQHVLSIYIRLLLKSFDNDGIVEVSHTIFTPQLLKMMLSFQTGNTAKEDSRIVEESLKLLEELNLLVFKNNTILMLKAENYVQSKLESSVARAERRRLNKIKKEKILNELSEGEITEEELFNKRFEEEYYPGLIYIGYAKEEEKVEYMKIFEMLFDDYENLDYISQSLSKFMDRAKTVDFIKTVTHKKDYLYKTLTKIIDEEIKGDNSIYELAFEKLRTIGFIKKFEDYAQFVSVFAEFRPEYSPQEINICIASFDLNKIDLHKWDKDYYHNPKGYVYNFLKQHLKK